MYEISDWIQIAEGRKCKNVLNKGSSIWIVRDGKTDDGARNDALFPFNQVVEGCARACSGISSVFRVKNCEKSSCRCICETQASSDGTCVLEDDDNLLLYKYVPKGFVFIFIHILGIV